AGTITGNATLTFDAGAVTVQDAASFKIDSNDGGEIGGDATINLSLTSLSVDGASGSLLVHIINFGGGNIGGSADLNVNLTGDLTTQENATFQVVNNDGGTGLGGGSIGGDATINVSVQNITAN